MTSHQLPALRHLKANFVVAASPKFVEDLVLLIYCIAPLSVGRVRCWWMLIACLAAGQRGSKDAMGKDELQRVPCTHVRWCNSTRQSVMDDELIRKRKRAPKTCLV